MRKYTGVLLLIAMIFLASVVSVVSLQWGGWMEQIMGRWFLFFGVIKLKDVPAFAGMFSKYDLFAMRYPNYGFWYPFIEILLGISYLFFETLVIRNRVLLVTMVVVGATAGGIICFMASGKKPLQCACLGSGFSLPLGWISLLEQLLMLFMAMYLFYFSFFPMKNYVLLLVLVVLVTGIVSGCGKKTVSVSEKSVPVVDAQANVGVEIVQVSHNGTSLNPEQIVLAAGKSYEIQVTPEVDGMGCMFAATVPTLGSESRDIKAGETFTIQIDNAVVGTYPVVCTAMGMKHGEIVVQ